MEVEASMLMRWTRGVRIAVPLLAVALLLGAGCGGDDAVGDAADATDPAAQVDGDNGGGGKNGGDGGNDGGGDDDADRCPLTAEQVSEVLGATVERDGAACTFYPPNAFSPRALFVPLPPGVCEDVEAFDPRLEPFDGLSVDAYAYFATAVPARILACGDAPFDVSTEIADDEAAAAAAVEELARHALQGG